MFTFDKDLNPDPIVVETAGGSFKLHHKFLRASDRTRVAEAIAAGLASVAIGQIRESEAMGLGVATAQRVLAEHIVAWEGVQDGNGTPVPLHEKDAQSGEKHSNLDAVMGMVPLESQLKTLLVQMAMNGMRVSDQLVDIVSRMLNDFETAERIGKEAELFLRGLTSGDGSSSTASATGATSTAPSDS